MEVLAACGPTLKSINVRGTEFTGKGVSKLPKFPCLETLKAGGCKNFTDAGLSEILPSCAQTLVSLDINTTGVALEAANLPPLPNIQNVSLGRTGKKTLEIDYLLFALLATFCSFSYFLTFLPLFNFKAF